ncbi:MAG: UDP-N-acetylglucosamine 3-dehydrogenase [Candidatus Marinamargulisbacteria bacterium]
MCLNARLMDTNATFQTNLRVGVVGLGNMGKHHARIYAQLENVTLAAICDHHTETLDQFSTQYACKGYTTLKEMLANENLDAISIAVPTAQHYDIAKTVIQQGIHVLIEKPITHSIETANEIVQLAKKHKVTLMIGHIERFNPAITKLKSLIDDGTFGKITSLVAKRVGVFPTRIKDANVIIDLAVHDIDIFSYLLGKEPDQVHGSGGKAFLDTREDHAEMLLSYGSQNCFIQVNWITPIRIRNLAITGTKGYAELNYISQELVFYESVYESTYEGFGDYAIKFGTPKTQQIEVEKSEPLVGELRHFVNAIKTKEKPLVCGETGTNALIVAEKVLSDIAISRKLAQTA